MKLLVLHPSMRTEWFRKPVPVPPGASINDEKHTAAQEAAVNRVKIIVESVARSYQQEASNKDSTSTSTSSGVQGTASGLKASSSLHSLFDVEVKAPVAKELSSEEKLQAELKRYYAFEGGRGDPDDPLGWWKVSFYALPSLAVLLQLNCLDRFMNHFSPHSRRWLAIFSPSQQPVSQLNACFRVLGVFVLTFAAR
jgi:hypothetical protein